MPADRTEATGATLREYAGVLWRRKWVIVAVIACATLAAYANAARKTPIYQASSTMMYSQQLDVANPLSTSSGYVDPNQITREVQSVGTVIASTQITNRVATQLGGEPGDDYGVSASSADVSSNSAYSSDVVSITASGPDPKVAANVANVYTSVFMAWRKERQVAQIDRAIGVLQRRIESFTSPDSQLSGDYILLRQRLQDLQILRATVTGDFELVTAAVPPSVPVAPKPKRSALLGFGVGIFAAIGLAFVLEQFDTRLTDYREAADILHMPVLGRLPKLSKKNVKEHKLVVLNHPGGRTAEAFRLLRGNLEFVNVDGNVRSIFVASCLAGEGKSTTVANLAATVALGGKSVALVDADLRKPTLHHIFEVDNTHGVSTLLTGQSRFEETVQTVELVQAPRGSNGDRPHVGDESPTATLAFVAAGPEPPNPGEVVASQRFAALIKELCDRYQVVFVDSPAMLAVGDVAALGACIDGLVMLVDFEAVRRPTLRDAVDLIEPLPCRKLGIIAARERVKRGEDYRYAYYRYGADQGSSKH